METRIIRTTIYRNSTFRKLSPSEKFAVLYLLTNEFLECIGAVEIDIDILAFGSGLSSSGLLDLMSKIGDEFQIIYTEGFLIIGEKFASTKYGGKTADKKERLMSNLPSNILNLLNDDGIYCPMIAQSLPNDCPTIAHINHKSKTINNKSEIINHKSEIINQKIVKIDYSKIEHITQDVLQELADKYSVPIQFAEDCWDSASNWLEANGRIQKNYRSFLANWIKRDKEKAINIHAKSNKLFKIS